MTIVLPARFACASLLALSIGCVNNYVVGDGSSTSGATDAASDATSVGDTPGSNTTGPGDGETTRASQGQDGTSTADPDPTSATDSSGGSGDENSSSDNGSGGDSGSELCQAPCSSDAECGGPGDLCVALSEAQNACLRACGRGCPPGFSCVMQTSVQRASDEQCTPDAGQCP